MSRLLLKSSDLSIVPFWASLSQ
jgi:hypothetical protein